jgi:hypothetical protein
MDNARGKEAEGVGHAASIGSNQKHQGTMKKNEKMKGFLGEWLEKSGKITEVITFNKNHNV